MMKSSTNWERMWKAEEAKMLTVNRTGESGKTTQVPLATALKRLGLC